MISKTNVKLEMAGNYHPKISPKSLSKEKVARTDKSTDKPAGQNPSKGQFRSQTVPAGLEDEHTYPVQRDIEKIDFVMDEEVKEALNNYQVAINRYNYADLSDPQVENLYFIERQVAFIGLRLALVKARIRNGLEPSLDYSGFEGLLKLVSQCRE